MGQSTIEPTPADINLAGKTVIITGGNSGLGYEAARQFLVLHASRVILAVRSLEKGQEAVSSLMADISVIEANPNAIIDVFQLDLDDYQSGVQFADKVKRDVKELDILLNNGGAKLVEYQESKSGHERVMQVNCYTHLLISLELLPLLRATAAVRGAPTRLTFVGSAGQTMHSLTKKPVATGAILEHFDNQNAYSAFARYRDSKLVINAYVRRLAVFVPSSEVIVNNVCPGLVATDFDKQLPAWLRYSLLVYRKLAARNVVEGSRTIIYASAVAGPDTHGKFLRNNNVDPGAPFLDEVAGKEFTDKVWDETVADASKTDPALKDFARTYT